MSFQPSDPALSETSRVRAVLTPCLVAAHLVVLAGLPLGAIAALWLNLETDLSRLILLGLAPALYAVGYALLAGILSVPHQWAIQPGRFPRDSGTRLYSARRLYGACLTSLYYFKPIYHAVLTVRPFKWAVFRLFGYRGTLNFTVYPDTWIRDLPLLEIGEGAYVSNRSTLGTNMCLHDGTILVDKVRIGSRALIGHLSMIAPGAVVGDNAEIGVGTAVGLRVRIGRGANVSGPTALHHACTIGEGASVGVWNYIGPRVRIDPGVNLPACSFVLPEPDNGKTRPAPEPAQRDSSELVSR